MTHGPYLHLFPMNQKYFYTETFGSDFSYIKVWLTDQNSKALEKEDINHRGI